MKARRLQRRHTHGDPLSPADLFPPAAPASHASAGHTPAADSAVSQRTGLLQSMTNAFLALLACVRQVRRGGVSSHCSMTRCCLPVNTQDPDCCTVRTFGAAFLMRADMAVRSTPPSEKDEESLCVSGLLPQQTAAARHRTGRDPRAASMRTYALRGLAKRTTAVTWQRWDGAYGLCLPSARLTR